MHKLYVGANVEMPGEVVVSTATETVKIRRVVRFQRLDDGSSRQRREFAKQSWQDDLLGEGIVRIERDVFVYDADRGMAKEGHLLEVTVGKLRPSRIGLSRRIKRREEHVVRRK